MGFFLSQTGARIEAFKVQKGHKSIIKVWSELHMMALCEKPRWRLIIILNRCLNASIRMNESVYVDSKCCNPIHIFVCIRILHVFLNLNEKIVWFKCLHACFFPCWSDYFISAPSDQNIQNLRGVYIFQSDWGINLIINIIWVRINIANELWPSIIELILD